MRERIHKAIDNVWPRAVLLPLAVAAVIALATLIAQPAQHDDDKVDDVLSSFVSAAGNLDGNDACKLLTPHAQQLVAAAIPGTTCSAYVHSFGVDTGGLGGVKLQLPRDLPDRVRLDASNMTGPNGLPVSRVIEMVRVGGDYRIDSLGY